MIEITCKICNQKFDNKTIGNHIRFVHKMKSKDYYDTYIKIDGEGICTVCGNPCKFWSISTGYAKTCSNVCGQLNPSTRSKIEQTNIERYGTAHPASNDQIKEKTRETNLNRYGTIAPYQNTNIKEKGIRSTIEKYGVSNVFKLAEIKEKSRRTMKEKYGEELNILRPEIKEHIKRARRELKYNEFIDRLARKHITYLDTEDMYVNHDCKRNYKCNLCDKTFTEESTQAYDVQCGCLRRRSSAEHEIYEWIVSLGFNAIQSVNISDDIGRMEIDISVDTGHGNKLGIEFCGLYWHSELFRPKEYHNRKLNAAIAHGYRLIQIFEDEWTNKKDIIKSVILQYLNCNKHIIYARKCNIVRLPKSPKDFLNNNHIQGEARASHAYALVYNSEIVSVCTFGKSRFSESWECIRYCNRLNTSVIGGFSRLLKAFIKEAHPTDIVSYADLRYFNGDMYIDNGFTQSSNAAIGYFYCPKGFQERLNRMQFQKHKLKHMKAYSDDKTELQIMTEEGFTRIYDAGQAAFKLHIQIS